MYSNFQVDTCIALVGSDAQKLHVISLLNSFNTGLTAPTIQRVKDLRHTVATIE
jgi:hypothetical protein